MIVERFGKFHQKLEGGIHCLFPMIESRRVLTWRYTESDLDVSTPNRFVQRVSLVEKQIDRIDLRDNLVDLPFQTIITRDNVQIQVHPMLLYRIHDPVRAAYEVYDLFNAVERIVQTTLRSIIGDMGLDDTLASREEINKLITQKIQHILHNWGLSLLKFEILEINPSPTILRAMHMQLSAERIRRAAIIRADGLREQMKTESEGACQALIAVSKGIQQTKIIGARALADSKLLIAKAEAESVKIISDALADYGVDPVQYLCALKYIDSFVELATRAASRNVYFPFNTGVIGTLKDISALPDLQPSALPSS